MAQNGATRAGGVAKGLFAGRYAVRRIASGLGLPTGIPVST